MRLDELIDTISTVHTDPLEQLTTAMLTAEHLGDVGDHLVGHFVDQARRSGASWTQIGSSMGVTKQAVQKRFVPRPGGREPVRRRGRLQPLHPAGPQRGRWPPRSRPAAAGHDAITPAHLVLGLLTEPDGVSGIVIVEAGATLEAVAEAAAAALPAPAAGELPALIPFDADAKKALELTFREALRLGHNYVGTEHVLLALLEQEDGSGPLSDSGVGKPDVEQRISSILDSLKPQPTGGATDSWRAGAGARRARSGRRRRRRSWPRLAAFFAFLNSRTFGERRGRADVGDRAGRLVGERRRRLLPARGLLAQALGQDGQEDLGLLLAVAGQRAQAGGRARRRSSTPRQTAPASPS